MLEKLLIETHVPEGLFEPLPVANEFV
jgi:hypothetical protein